MSEALFTCQRCGKEFPPEPDAVVESGFEPACVCCDGVHEDEIHVTVEEMQNATDEQLREWGLTRQQQQALLRGEAVETAAILCKECQDQMLAESGPNPGS